jgi:hypothetical protein
MNAGGPLSQPPKRRDASRDILDSLNLATKKASRDALVSSRWPLVSLAGVRQRRQISMASIQLNGATRETTR